MKRTESLLIIMQLFAVVTLHAKENRMIDSLENELSKAAATEDSIKILCHLTWNISTYDPEKTFYYGTKALSLIKGDEESRTISEAYDAAALAHWVTRDFASAIRLYKISLKIGEENKLPDRIAWCHYNLASIALNENQPDLVLEHTEKSQAAFHEANMDDWMINSYWLMLKAVDGDRREQLYKEMISKIEDVIQSTDDPNNLTFRYLDLAKVYSMLENQSKSLEYVLQALEVAEKANNQKVIAYAYSSIGAYLRDIQHNHTVALQYYEKILEIYRKYNVSWGTAEVLIEIGIVYKEMQNDSLAFRYFTESLEISSKIDYSYSMSKAYKNMGEIYFRNKDFEKALSLFLKSYNVKCKNCNAIYAHEILIHLGNTYSQMGDKKAAYNFYLKSFRLADSLDDRQHRSISLVSLGDWQIAKNNIPAATNNYLQALENASKTKNLSLQIKISDKLSEIYSQQNNYQSAFKYQQLSDLLEDSILVVNETENLARLETLFEFENLRRQKEVENAKAEAEIEKQVLTRNLFLAGFILMSILGAFLFLSFRRKKKANILLESQKKKIEDMSAKIHKADKMKLQFFTNISHEFRTPLTLITGLTEELPKHKINGETWKNQLRIIQKNASKLLHLVNQILDIRKLDNGDAVVEPVRGDMVKFVSGIVALFEDYARRKHVELKFVSEKNTMILNSDYDKLDKILNNLISNAIKFCGENDRVRVTLYSENHPQPAFVIEVEDSGKGISSKQIEHVFQPFYQATDSYGGSGIGLALVKELVALLQGHINIESQLDKGTRVRVKIPFDQMQNLSKDKSQSARTARKREPQTAISSFTTDENPVEINQNVRHDENDGEYEKSLLIVEDNVDLLEFVGGILNEDYKILKAVDGKKGLAMAVKHIPDIIVSDIMMPVMDGIQMCKKLKNNPCTSHIPILLLTAKTDQDSMLRSFKIGADDFIIKPFSAVLLKSRIQNLVNQRRKLIEKFSQRFQVEPSEVILPDADKCFLEKTIAIIEKYINDPELDIDILASEMNVSRTQLYRKLKALTDCSGNQFIRVIRLKRAAQLLSQNQLNIFEVMQETGFSNYSYFNQCFKEQFNRSPKSYSELSQATK
ncbi:MAG: tetratricopeptide repeat protein [Bacteroidales bacterium]|nr:tetratricopeptide repeat protein [Bacteroidales bacterium]